jgi:alpha-L-fucosidase
MSLYKAKIILPFSGALPTLAWAGKIASTILLLWTATVCLASVIAAPGDPNNADPNNAIQNYTTVSDFVRHLIDTAAKGENALPNGLTNTKLVFPSDQQPRINELRQWMRTNDQSLFGTTAGRFRDLPFGRSTTGDKCIYLHIYDWPKDGRLTLPGLMTTPAGAVFLGEPNCPIGITCDATDVILAVPDTAPDSLMTVIKLEFDKTPEITYGPEIFPTETTFTRPIDITFGDFVVDDSYRIYYTLDGTDPNISSLCYEEPFTLRKNATIACRKITPNGKILSPISRKTYTYIKK